MATHSHFGRSLQVFVHADYEEMSHRASRTLLHRALHKPDLLLCAATGSSPTRTYELVSEAWRGRPDLSGRLRVIKLDEWGGLPPDDPGTCESYLRRLLLGPLGIPDDRYIGFRGDAADPQAECRAVADRAGAAGPIDVCVLGLGLNGHLGFNEPADALRPHAHVAPLSAESLAHPMVRGSRTPVSFGLTLGIADLLQSRQILLLVNGRHKRDVLRRLLDDRTVSPRFPASFLWLHPDVSVFCDADAAGD
jgi:galactosamine-6-phosphate isomerase